MKIIDMNIGDTVEDEWFSDPEYHTCWGLGKITRVLKTVVYVHFTGLGKEVKYDKVHANRYLNLAK